MVMPRALYTANFAHMRARNYRAGSRSNGSLTGTYDGPIRTRANALISRRLVVIWVLIALPFWLTAATGGPGGETIAVPGAAVGRLLPHAVYHPVYVVILVGAIVLLLRFRIATHFRVVRGIALALAIAQAAAIVGMAGEEISVMQHGGLAAGKEVFKEPLHLASALVTEPALLASQVLLIVMTIFTIRATRAEQRLAARDAISETPNSGDTAKLR